MTTVVFTRLATLADAEATRAIYNREVAGSTVTFDLVPRSLAEQRAWLLDHAGAHPAIVAVDGGGPAGRTDPSEPSVGTAGGEIVGFASLTPYRTRPAYATSVEDSVYVRDDQRGRGVGRLLLTDLLALARTHGFHAVFARIVGGHERSIALHASCGFEAVGVEREVGRKFGTWLDVVLMECLLG